MTRFRTRLIVGALAVALPLAAVVSCGTEKKKTIKAELKSAADNLQSSKAVSVALRFSDAQGKLEKLISSDEDAPPSAVTKALLGGSISFTVDPAGNKTLQDLQTKGKGEADLKADIKNVNAAFVVSDDKGALAELRLVDGTLYAHVDLAEINRLAKLADADPVDEGLDEALGDDPDTSKALADVRAGKWLKLPLTDYIDRFKELAEGFQEGLEATPAPEPSASAQPDYQALGERVMRAIKPYVKVTDANDDKADRVLDIKVQVRPALKAALAALKATKDLPFAQALKDFDPAEIDKKVSDGTAHGTITLSNSHFKQLAIDLESLRTLDPERGANSLEGATIRLDVDDSAGEVQAPTDVSSFNIGDMLDDMLSSFEDEQAA